MAADPTPTQSDTISQFRAHCGLALTAIAAINADRLKAAALGGFDAFSQAAFAGSNGDIAAADVDAAMDAMTSLRGLLFDPTSGNPTRALLAIVKVAR